MKLRAKYTARTRSQQCLQFLLAERPGEATAVQPVVFGAADVGMADLHEEFSGKPTTGMEQLDGEKLAGLELSAHNQGNARGREVSDRRGPGTAGAGVDDLTPAARVATGSLGQPALQIVTAAEERHPWRLNFRPRLVIIQGRGWVVHHRLAHSVGAKFRTGRRGLGG